MNKKIAKNKFQSFWFASTRHIIISYELRLAFIYCCYAFSVEATEHCKCNASDMNNVFHVFGFSSEFFGTCNNVDALTSSAVTKRDNKRERDRDSGHHINAWVKAQSNCKPNKFNYITRSWHSLLSFSTTENKKKVQKNAIPVFIGTAIAHTIGIKSECGNEQMNYVVAKYFFRMKIYMILSVWQ